jgi:DNA-binding LacI/PurR family transcriptional regulator
LESLKKESRVYITDLTFEMNRQVTLDMLAREDRPDAIFAMIDPIGCGSDDGLERKRESKSPKKLP